MGGAPHAEEIVSNGKRTDIRHKPHKIAYLCRNVPREDGRNMLVSDMVGFDWMRPTYNNAISQQLRLCVTNRAEISSQLKHV